MAEVAGQDGHFENSGSEHEGGWRDVKYRSSSAKKGVSNSETGVKMAAKGVKTSQGRVDDELSIKSSENKSNRIEKYLSDIEKGNKMFNKELQYTEENTVTVTSNTIGLTDIDEMMDSIEKICGDGSVIGCVKRGMRRFEVTLSDESLCDLLVPTFQVGRMTMNATPVKQKFLVVSIFHLPVYVKEEEILRRLESFGLEIISPVYRKDRIRKDGKSAVDGTRFVHAIFPEHLKSLPYNIKINVRGKIEYFNVKHDYQIKVCNKCYSDKHLARDCPRNMCFICHQLGHISFDCELKGDCDKCGDTKLGCKCKFEYEYIETEQEAEIENDKVESQTREDDSDTEGDEEERNNERTDECNEPKGDGTEDGENPKDHIAGKSSTYTDYSNIEDETNIDESPLDLRVAETNHETSMETDEMIRKRKADYEIDTNNTDNGDRNKRTNKMTKKGEKRNVTENPVTEMKQDGVKKEVTLSHNELRHPTKLKDTNTKEVINGNERPHFPKEKHKLIQVTPNLKSAQRLREGKNNI